jgi:DNA-binding SARP family transcriptional activator
MELPAADRQMLVRPALLDRLRQRWFARVTVVSAPAGYGKTTLLTQAVAANAAAAAGIDCWLSCDAQLAAASALGRALCRTVAAPWTGQADVPDLTTAIVEAMWRRSPQQVALLLDDVHEIPPGSEAANLLGSVVAALPANGHVVLAGRRPPPLPLGRLEVEGRVVHIDEADLAFDAAELTEFAALRQVARSKVAGCGGWPAFAELSASARSGATGDYVGQEVLSQWPRARRRDLAVLAHLGSFDDDLARDALGSEVDLGDLVAGLPLVNVVAEGERSLHSLWRSLLSDEAAPGDVAEARRQAGASLLRRGRVDRAIALLIEAEAWDEVAQAITVALGAAHPPVDRDVLEEWCKLLPAEVRATPSGRLLAAVVTVEGDLGGAWQDFEECAADFRRVGATTGELACLVQLAQVAWWSDRPERLAAVAARAFELEAAGCAEAVPFACLARALLFDIADDSSRMLSELDRIPAGSLNETWLGLVRWARAIAHLQLGNAAAAQDAADHALAYAGTMHAPLAGITRLQALWYQGQLGEVLDGLPALLHLVRRSGYRNSTVLIAAECSTAHAFKGQRDQATRYLEQARATATLVPDAPLVATNLSIAEAALAVASGDEPSAAAGLTAYVARHPLGQGLCVAAQRRHLALFYVLVPSTRPAWDDAELGPAWLVGRDLARAVTAVREHRRLPSDTPALDDAGVVQAHLPSAWVAELGVAAVAAGREDGWRLLDATWPVTCTTVADLADIADLAGRGGRGAGPMRNAARRVVGRLPAPPTARLELRLLGAVELLGDDVPAAGAPDWRRERVRSLLAYLALHGTVSRGQLADDLWPALDPVAQARNLRVTLTYLLRVLEPRRAPRDASFYVRQHGGNLSLHPGDWLTVDVWHFDRLCAQADDADRRGAPTDALDHALRAVDLWRGEPTELLSNGWAIAPFEQRRRRFTTVATRAGELLVAQRDFGRALELAEAALAIDPWLEAAHRLVVAAHRAAGDDLAARGALRRYRAAIHELGLAPDEATLMVGRLLDRLPTAPDG